MKTLSIQIRTKGEKGIMRSQMGNITRLRIFPKNSFYLREKKGQRGTFSEVFVIVINLQSGVPEDLKEKEGMQNSFPNILF